MPPAEAFVGLKKAFAMVLLPVGRVAPSIEFLHTSASRKGRYVQWGTVPPEEKSGTFVAWVASAEETKQMKPTDKAIFGMVSESPGRNASEPSGGLDKKISSGGRALSCGAKAAWHAVG